MGGDDSQASEPSKEVPNRKGVRMSTTLHDEYEGGGEGR
jgi:hypothetical protein